jgi:DNA-binding beta-propeller fold protein YncE
VADFQTSQVTPVNLTTMAPGPPIAVGGNPTDIAGAPTSTTAYVSGGDGITAVDWQTLQAGPAFTIGTTAEALALAPGGTTAWVCGGNGDLVHISLPAGSVIGKVAVGGVPGGVVIATGHSSSG